ncbi:MAG: ribonuclease P [Candidatus Bathyarchaeia archaeon]|nr:ribonuclease P [Candidatus Bathyarchaeota archaeon]
MARISSRYKELASERIERLFELAGECFKESPHLADRYVELARKIGMKCRVRIPKHLKMRFCKGCGSYLVFGVNSRVRTRPEGYGRVVVTCLKCGMVKRYPMLREKTDRRKSFGD